jgi:hypothetical protein
VSITESAPRPRERPSGPPPFPPEAWLIGRRRRRALAAAAFLIVVSGAVWWGIGRGEPPPSRAATGLPFPGLVSDSRDAVLRDAPVAVFKPLAWSDLRGVGVDRAGGADSGRGGTELEPVGVTIPDSLQALAGRPVRVEGFMVPLDPGAVTLDFVIVPDMSRCWFCEAPDPRRSIYARGAFGPVPVEYDRPVRVDGVLNVGVVTSGRSFHSALRLRAVRVEVL